MQGYEKREYLEHHHGKASSHHKTIGHFVNPLQHLEYDGAVHAICHHSKEKEVHEVGKGEGYAEAYEIAHRNM